MKLTISGISSASPDLDDARFDELVEDIRKRGQLLPIWVQGDQIIDGRKRYRACEKLGIEPNIINVAEGESAAEIAYALNGLRTHYSKPQLALFATKLANYPNRAPKSKMSSRRHLKTQGEIAARLGISRNSIAMANVIRRDGAPEVVAAIEAGKLSLSAATKIVKSTAKNEQAAAMELATRKEPAMDKTKLSRAEISLQKFLNRLDINLSTMGIYIDGIGVQLHDPRLQKHNTFKKWLGQFDRHARRAIRLVGKYR